MGRVIAYIATSLDGYLAAKNDDLTWLDAYNSPGEDHGYAQFMKNVGAAVMGTRTYKQSLKHPERLITGTRNYVLSHAPMTTPPGVEAEFHEGRLAPLIAKIRTQTDRDIFVVGGGQVLSALLNASLVDELWHFVAPVLLGEGIPLYSALAKKVHLRLVDVLSYKTGIVRLRYVAGNQTPSAPR